MKYFDIRDVFRQYPGMTMYFVFGERSNGKTYSCLDYAIEIYAKEQAQTVYLRRSREDVRSHISGNLLSAHMKNKRFEHWFKDMELPWNAVRFTGSALYPQHHWFSDKGVLKKKTAETPMILTAALSTWDHTKGISFPDVKFIMFDEFLTTGLYLPGEVNIFQNVLSSFIRERDDVKVVLLGNTVDKYSPYFSELGLKHISDMKPGDAQVYESGDKKAKYLVMLTPKAGEKKSDAYFSVFDNATSAMIRGGLWEMSAYPIIPDGLSPKTIKPTYIFFISFAEKLVRCNMILLNQQVYFTCHGWNRKYVVNDDGTRTEMGRNYIIYTDYMSLNPSDRYNMLNQHGDRVAKLFREAVSEGRIYFSNNETGDLVSNYYRWCNQTSIL